jgi:hypothetical protein
MRGALNSAAGLGLALIFATFTVSHKQGESCKDVVNGLLAAYRGLKSGKAWQEFKHALSMAGSVRALEVTYGKNGWHAHLHVVFFVGEPDVEGAKKFFKNQWLAALNRVGRSALATRGVVVEVGDDAIGNYLNKMGDGWNLESEMAKGTSKVSKGKKGRTPFQLLLESGEKNELGERTDKALHAAKLFKEYARAFKKKSQLQFTPGLLDLLEIRDLSDKELAETPEEKSRKITEVLNKQWALLERFRARGEFLEAFNDAGIDGANVFLDVLAARAAEGERGNPTTSERPRARKNAVNGVCILCGGPVQGSEKIHQVCRESKLERGGNKPPPVE